MWHCVSMSEGEHLLRPHVINQDIRRGDEIAWATRQLQGSVCVRADIGGRHEHQGANATLAPQVTQR